MNTPTLDIAAHIPHAGSMCLLDAVEHWDADSLHARTHAHQRSDNPLRHQGRLGAACGIEIAAQGMALHGALRAQHTPDQRPRAGFLASVRDIRLHTTRLDNLPGALHIHIERLSGDDNTVLYRFRVAHEGHCLLEGRAAVMLDAAKASHT